MRRQSHPVVNEGRESELEHQNEREHNSKVFKSARPLTCEH